MISPKHLLSVQTKQGLYQTMGELLFVALPLVVVILNRLIAGENLDVVGDPDLSFLTVILNGQAIMHYSGRRLTVDNDPGPARRSFVIACVVVIGLLPAVMMLVWTLNAGARPPRILAYLQVVSAVQAVFTFLSVGLGASDR